MSYTISIATIEEIDAIMEYIKNNWKANHILSWNKELVVHEFIDRENLNFIIAKNEKKEIVGLLGFIKASSTSSPDLWPTIWIVSKGLKNPMLGIKLLNYARKKIPHRAFIGAGANSATLGIYKHLGIFTDVMDQYYILNKNINKYNITKVIADKNSIIENNTKKYEIKKINTLIELDSFDFEQYSNFAPFKDKDYIEKRFFSYPIFSYDTYAVVDANSILSLIIIREVEANGSKALRIVDFYGDEKYLSDFTYFVQENLFKTKYEYIDFLCYGFEQTILEKAGFKKLDYSSNEIIIPNYFQPFIQENKVINFFAEVENGLKYRICKADGDQDRPNIFIEEKN